MKVFSTFTGIGGFEVGIHSAWHDLWMQGKAELSDKPELIGCSEIDKYAISVFDKHFKGVKNYGNITEIDADALPNFDLLVGGFPCQAFSIAGKRGGFSDTRGTLFFDLARILRAKQPRLFIFENVKGLVNHDSGKTLRTIITTIDELGYDCQWQVLNSKDFGVPQNRERIFIIGHLRRQPRPQVFPITRAVSEIPAEAQVKVGTLRTHKDGHGFREKRDGLAPTLAARAREDGSGQAVVYVPEATKKGYAEARIGDSINLQAINSKTRRGRVGKGLANTLDTGMFQHTIDPNAMLSKTVRAGGRNSPHGAKQNWDSYEINGKIRRLTPMECERLQAFPDNWTQYASDGTQISDAQRYKMCGNAVTTNVVKAIYEKIIARSIR